jgi:hypothetical protein
MRVRTPDALLLVLSTFAGLSSLTAQDAPASPPTGLIVGRVIDAESGRPVSGATVALSGGNDGQERWVPTRLTGPDGYFVYRNLRAGVYGLSARKPGYAAGGFGRTRPNGPSRQVTLEDGERVGDVLLRVWKLGAIGGTVLDEAGEPVVGMPMRCWTRTSSLGEWRPCSPIAFTDDRGQYRVWNLLPGEYAIGTVTFPIAAAPSPLDGIQRTRRLLFGAAREAPAAAAGPRGLPSLVYPPTFHPAARSPDNATIVSIVSGEERSGVDLRVQAETAVRISGTIVGADESVRLLSVRLVPAGGEDAGLLSEPPTVQVRPDRTFTFQAVPAGQYVLRVSTPPIAAGMERGRAVFAPYWAEVPLAVGADDVDGVTIALRRGLTISGHAEFDGTIARPGPEELQRIAVDIQTADRNPILRILPRSTQPDATGHFTSAGLAPGRYYVRVIGSPNGWMFKAAMLNGRDASVTPLEIRNDDVRGVVLTFTDRWTSLSGTVQSREGTPEESAMVLVFPTDSQLWMEGGRSPRRTRGVRPGAGGAYKLGSVPSGDYFVIAIPEEQAADWREPKFLEILSRQAAIVTIGDGEHKVHHLRTQVVR